MIYLIIVEKLDYNVKDQENIKKDQKTIVRKLFKDECMYLPKCILLIIITFLFTPTAQAKKRCKPLLEKLQNIQALQRHGYSAKRGLSLRAREDKARDKWWQCEKSGGKKQRKSNKKYQNKTVRVNTKFKVEKSNAKRKTLNAGSPFKTTSAIVFKSKYQGNKKQAWLTFYQQPSRCQRPKSLQAFALCSENKRTQRLAFEQKYNQKSYK